MKQKNSLITVLIIILILVFGYYKDNILKENEEQDDYVVSYSIEDIPEYNGEPYVVLNDNEPDFDDSYKVPEYFEVYNSLDSLGRARQAFASVAIETMPVDKRESIGNVKPTGWHTVKYSIVDGKYLYNRCHLIGYQLTGENANEKNLITCTRYMNTVGMLEFENKVADYVKETNNHVLYRVTPIYYGDNLLASGVQIEAYSIEDNGEGIKFNVFVYNVQEGIEIDYKSGESRLKNEFRKRNRTNKK